MAGVMNRQQTRLPVALAEGEGGGPGSRGLQLM
jgi:hypothetical protein